MAAPSAWEVHNLVKDKMANKEIDFAADTFVIRLYTSASDIDTIADNDASAATNELTTANGYTVGGDSVTGSVSESNGTVTVDFTDSSWAATGAGITARFAAIIDTTLTPDEIIAHAVLDSTPADVTAPSGNLLVIQFHGLGAFQIT